MIKNKMTWVGGQKRWIKEYRGKTYAVSCKQLEAPPTKEQSVHAANLWWQAKQRELELAEEASKHPRSDAIVDALRANLGTPVETSKDVMGAILSYVEGGSLPDWLTAAVLGRERVEEIESTVQALIENKPDARDAPTIGQEVGKWLNFLRGQVDMRQMDPGRYGSYARHAQTFAKWAGEAEDIGTITAAKLEAYWAYLAGAVAEKRWAPATAQTMFMTARQFIGRLCEHGLIPTPGNIRSKRLKFTQDTKSVERFTVEEVKALLAAATDKTRLYILLQLNCGMYQNDIAELGREEVDWTDGSLKRPRSKTPKGPCVRYKLWPETFALLKRFESKADVDNGRGGNRAILTDEDKPLVRQWIEGGKMRRYDTIRSALLTTAEKTGIGKSPKLFRKTSASELASSPHAPLVDVFLCHSPKSLAEKHYVALTDDVLDGAMTYLHGRYFGGGKTPDVGTAP